VASGGDASKAAQAEASQCVAVTGGAPTFASVKARLAGSAAGQAALGLTYFASDDCSGSFAGTFSSQAASPTEWQTLVGVPQVPANVRSLLVRLVVLRPAGQSAAEALFDDVVVTR
jgi:hypothetical protein